MITAVLRPGRDLHARRLDSGHLQSAKERGREREKESEREEERETKRERERERKRV